MVTAVVVAILCLLAPSSSAAPLLPPQTRVAAIEHPASQLVGPSETVLPGGSRPRAPSYDGSATGSSVAAEEATAADAAGESEADVTFGHGARHLAGTGLDQVDVEAAIESQVRTSASAASSTGSFWGRVVVDGQTVEYRAYTLPNGTINVGTYYVP
jgi:hypothetical protein